MIDFQVYTYGGGKILKGIFEAIAMLSNGKGSLYHSFIIIGLNFGFFWAITKAFFRPSIDNLYGKFFIPVLILVSALLLPKATVYINDPTEISNDTNSMKFAKVDNVPYILAMFSQVISTIGHQTTKALETVMHMPDDISYNKTGHIFGAETILDSKKYIITNEDLSKNLRTLVHKCVIPDIQLGRYKMDDLYKSKDLYSFLEANTSKVLAMDYIPVGSSEYKEISPKNNLFEAKDAQSSNINYKEDRKLKNVAEIKSCCESLQEMKPHINNIGSYYLKNYLKAKTSSFKALTKLNIQSKDLIEQQLLINAINNTDNPIFSFAKHRANMQQRDTYQLVGALAGKSLVVLRNVFEALIYCSFLLIIPLLLFPGGWKLLGTWAQLVLWVQLWPPFYAILNYIMQIIAQGKAHNIFNGLGEQGMGLSIFTLVGLENLNADMFALAGYLSASIPFLSYTLIKGGVSSFVHLASSMMTPIHASAGAAATEKVTGNYSYGNVSYGNLNYGNTSLLQRNHSPSYSGGFATDSSASSTISYGDAGETIMQQKTSQLRTNISFDNAVQNTLQQNKQELEGRLQTTQSQYSESVQDVARASSSFISHQAHNLNMGHSQSNSMDESTQESFRNILSTSQDYAKSHGIDDLTAIDGLVTAGLSTKVIGLNGSLKSSATSRDGLSEIEKIASSDDFQKNLQATQRYAETLSNSSSDDMGSRLAKDLSTSKDRMQMAQETNISAYQQMEQFSEVESYMKSNSGRIHANYNQDFIRYGLEKYESVPELESILDKPNDNFEKQELYAGFQKDYIEPKIKGLIESNNLKSSHEANTKHIKNRISSSSYNDSASTQKTILERGQTLKKGDSFLSERSHMEKVKNSFHDNSSQIQNKRNQIKLQESALLTSFQKEKNQSITEKAHRGKTKLVNKTKNIFGGKK